MTEQERQRDWLIGAVSRQIIGLAEAYHDLDEAVRVARRINATGEWELDGPVGFGGPPQPAEEGWVRYEGLSLDDAEYEQAVVAARQHLGGEAE